MSTNLWEERIDLKKLWKQIVNKLWIVIAATLVGAISGVLIYYAYSVIKSGNQVYQIRNDYYIYLDYEGYPNGPDYYNAYTWDSILRDDPIVNYALEINPMLTKEDILNSVSGEILGDYRILTVVVRGINKELIQSISDTYKEALPHFGEEIDMIDHIEIWTDAAIEEFDEYTREGNAAFLGAFIGLLISLFALIINCVLDDRIYNERDWHKRYPNIPYLGKAGTKEYEVNAAYILENEGDTEAASSLVELRVSDFIFDATSFEKMSTSNGVLLFVNTKKDSGEEIDKVVFTLCKQNINILAAVIE